jgi:hypothetical protein
MRAWLIGLGVAAAAGGLLWTATWSGAGVHCDACVSFEGREACRSATGPSRDEAERAAIMTACALVSGGVTQTIQCQGQVPLSMTCSER